jgi:hypothetical protein
LKIVGLPFRVFGINVQINNINNLKNLKMTKLFSIIAVAALATTFVACGPSAEEKAKLEEKLKREGDSIAAAISATMQESMNTATEAAATATDAAAATATAAVEAATKH